MPKRKTLGHEGLLLCIFGIDEDNGDLLLLRDGDKRIIDEIILNLTEKEQKVIRMRFAIGKKLHTVEEIKKKLEITKGRVYQLESKALRKLKRPHRKEVMRKFFRSELERMLASHGKNAVVMNTRIGILEMEIAEYKRIFSNFSRDFQSVHVAAGDPVVMQVVEKFEISTRAYNYLKQEGIRTVGELASKTEAELLQKKNSTRKVIRELENEILIPLGLKYGMDVAVLGTISV